jgi:hypothetical protein
VSPEASPAGGNAPEDTRVSGTAFLYAMLTTMRDAADLLGRPGDAAHFADRAAVVKEAFNDAYLDQAAGYYKGQSGDRGYRQTHNVLALAFGLTPDDETAQRVADSIAADVRARGTTLNTGVLGTKFLLPVLSEHGYADLAYALAVQTKYPSWGYMIEHGATSMWEHWSTDARSLGHYFLGTVDDWFYHYVAGIRPSRTDGYRRTTIAPVVDATLDHASATTATPFGPVSSSWQQADDGVALQVTVPANATAEVHVPARSRWAVTEGGIPAADAEAVTFLRMEDDAAVFEVGSGDYEFAVDPVLGRLGDARDDADSLADLVAGLQAPGAPAARTWTEHLVTSVGQAWDSHLDVDDAASAASVHRALAVLGDIERWAALQVENGRLSEADGDAVQALVDAIAADLSAASGRLLGATATVEIPVQQWFPGSTVPVTVVVANGGSSPLTSVSADLAAGDGWTVTPEPDPETTVEPGDTLRLRYDVAVPLDAEPGPAAIDGTLTYRYRGSSARLPVGATIALEPPVAVQGASVTPTPAAPGDPVTVAVELTNRTDRTATGSLTVTTPDGWADPEAVAWSLAAGETATVDVGLEVPLTVTEGGFDLQVAIGDHALEQRTASGQVRIVNPPAGPVDHVDLGNGTSEAGHRLTASPASGTSAEAGLTRRYTNNTVANGWFEFDLAVPAGERFVIRAVETYDSNQNKTYDVLLDGQVAHERRYQRSGGGGTVSYQFVVEPSADTADGAVRVRFQDVPGGFDPSIADVWSVPVG